MKAQTQKETSEEHKLLLLRREVELQRQLNKIYREFGLLAYRPHKKQDAFHRSLAKYRAIFSGNRFGKSTCGCAEDCAWLLGERPWIPENDPGRKLGIPDRPVKGLVITTDWSIVDDVFTNSNGDNPGKFWKMLPRGFVKKALRNHMGVIDTLICANGSLLKFDTERAYLANEQKAESKDWDFIHGDEPFKEKMFKAHNRGLIDRNGRAWFTLTPLREPWLIDFFFPGAKNKRTAQSNEVIKDGKPLIWVTTGSIYDNPHLSQEAIAAFEMTLTAEEKQCRLSGIPLHLVGLVYKEFDYDRHVMKKLPEDWDSWDSPPRSWTLNWYADVHPRTKHHVLFCWASPMGHLYYTNEIFEWMDIPSLCARIRPYRDRYLTFHEQVDQLAWHKDEGGTVWADMFVDNGIIVDPAPKDLNHGIVATRRALTEEINGIPRIRIAPTMGELIHELTHYAWDEKSEKRDKPIDKDDHAVENLYRSILSDPVWIEPSTSAGPVDYDIIDRPLVGKL